MVVYEVIMPRWAEDIVTRKRTLIHFACRPEDPVLNEGDSLQLCDRDVELATNRAMIRVTVTSVSKVRLVESLTPHPGTAALDDMARLNLMPAIDHARMAACAPAFGVYRRRWNAVNPDALWESNPTVWRIVFRYLETPPEFSTAARKQRTP